MYMYVWCGDVIFAVTEAALCCGGVCTRTSHRDLRYLIAIDVHIRPVSAELAKEIDREDRVDAHHDELNDRRVDDARQSASERDDNFIQGLNTLKEAEDAERAQHAQLAQRAR